MLNWIKKHYGAGYRAGLAGLRDNTAPKHLNVISSYFWHEGWFCGMNKRLTGISHKSITPKYQIILVFIALLVAASSVWMGYTDAIESHNTKYEEIPIHN